MIYLTCHSSSTNSSRCSRWTPVSRTSRHPRRTLWSLRPNVTSRSCASWQSGVSKLSSISMTPRDARISWTHTVTIGQQLLNSIQTIRGKFPGYFRDNSHYVYVPSWGSFVTASSISPYDCFTLDKFPKSSSKLPHTRQVPQLFQGGLTLSKFLNPHTRQAP